MQLSLELIFLFLLLVWMTGLSLLFLKLKNQYQLFVDGSEKHSLSDFLAKVMQGLTHNEKTIHEISHRVDGIENENKLHIQKIGLLRFNPFRDTGGEQSFVLSLIDAHDTGIVISALYSRSGTRWYVKKVLRGKGEEHELSDEEEKAIKLAKTVKKP